MFQYLRRTPRYPDVAGLTLGSKTLAWEPGIGRPAASRFGGLMELMIPLYLSLSFLENSSDDLI